MVTSSRARVVVLSVLGMLLIQVAWILAVPPFMGIDEIDHTYRASSIGLGDPRPIGSVDNAEQGRGDLIQVRSDVAQAARPICRTIAYYGKTNCASPTGFDSAPGFTVLASSAARYNPAYYAVVDVIARPFHGYGYLWALRAASALLCTIMFGAGVWAIQTFARTRWPMALFFLGTTPVTLYSTTVAAPNGVEMVSGLTLWAALLGLFWAYEPPPDRDRRILQLIAAVSGAALVTVHTLGPLWLAQIGIVVLVLVGPTALWRRLRAHPVGNLVVTAVLGLSTLAAIVWLVTAKPNNPASEHVNITDSPFPGIFLQVALWPLQAIGSFPTRTEPAPLIVYAIALAVMLGATVVAARHLRGRVLAAQILLVVLSLSIPVTLSVLTYHQIGYAWQGRYSLPLCVGYFLILGIALDRAQQPRPLPAFPLFIAAVLLVVELVASTHGVVERELTSPLWEGNPHWHVPGVVLLTVLVLVGCLLWLEAATRSAPERPPDPEELRVPGLEHTGSDS